jgi:hypothetical protein
MSYYTYKTEAQVRKAFWATSNCSKKKITDYSGNGKMYPIDTRCAWTDFIDCLSKSDEISRELAYRVTLEPRM